MSRTVTVVTPENIEITYRLAGFASRFIATFIDLAIQLVLILVVRVVFEAFAGALSSVAAFFATLLRAGAILGIFLAFFAYSTVFEMIWGGRTPGKRVMGLRVIRDGGYPINFVASIVRNVLRFADIGLLPLPGLTLMLFGLPGLLCIFFSPTYKRIGDYAAGTLVIVDKHTSSFALRRDASAHAGVEAFAPLLKNVERLSIEEYQLVRRFTMRRAQLEPAVQAGIAERIAVPLMHKLEIQAHIAYQIQFADFLEALERRYAEDHGVL